MILSWLNEVIVGASFWTWICSKNHHEHVCSLKNGLLPHHAIPILHLPLNCTLWKKWTFFKILEIQIFMWYSNSARKTEHFDMYICYVSTKFRESWFFHLSCKTRLRLENQLWFQFRSTAQHAHCLNSIVKLETLEFWRLYHYDFVLTQLGNSRPNFLNLNLFKNHHQHVCSLKVA